MQLETFDSYPARVLRVLLALKKLEDRQQHATYDGLAYVLGTKEGPADRASVYQSVLEARRLQLVQVVEQSSGGRGQKTVFGLTEKGREALRG